MKANRKFKNEDEAVSAVIGVILMVAITVAIAATVYVYVSGMLGGGPSKSATVGLVQSGDFIMVTKVDSTNAIPIADCTASVIDNTGAPIEQAWIRPSVTGETDLTGGATIMINATSATFPNVPYTVNLVYNQNTLGTATFHPSS